ncbi:MULTISPECIES: MFS transporter [Micromonospora]|uniref:MFS transporter n=1 Tax=Micromonospora solifontis TaxID=2487138 RepID=A0ABX9WLP3_9ACTN|nr:MULTISPECIES: MFS transporter [Micromonospora]NES16104.1 MFS transporter [Micromonospora sp. PPF5-17B]NES34908.1 MFS transporter [Micromonospora solifontis]NES57626.1 MFS transporter [Micromonospora sp. PPF5-6]RNM01473.1 MFS transporter [Micromonospora solifontis]
MRLLPEPGPARTLALSTLVNTIGRGTWLTASALFLTRSVGLSVSQVGLGLTLTALVSLVASAPMGYLADRYGPRGLQLGALLASAVCTAALLAVGSFATFLLIGALMALVDAASRGSRGALIAGAVPPDQRVRTRAYLRAVTNVGISVGAVLAGVGLAADTRAAYAALILLDALTYLLAAAVLLRLPAVPPVPAPTHGPRLIALRDRPFLAFTVLDGLMSMHFGLLNIALPLWIAEHTTAPRWLISACLLVNTVMVVLFQVRASRGTEELAGAGRAARRAGAVIAVACALFAASGGVSAAVAVPLLLGGALVHVVGELWHAAAGWGISFGLAPAHAQGQYQGAYGMGMQLGSMVAPVVVTTLAVGWGVPGWLLLGGMFLVLGLLVPPVVRWAARTRPTEPVGAPVPVG